jgi:hypothetical protein
MRSFHHWITVAVVAGAAGGVVAAPAVSAATEQPEAPSMPAAQTLESAAAQEALASAEDITLLKALSPLGLTRTQLSALLPALHGTQAKLAELKSKEATKLGPWQDTLEQARRDLLAGKGTGARASEQFALARWGAAQYRAGRRADVVSSLKATLEKMLTPAQAAQMAESGQATLLAQRMAGWRGGGGGPRSWSGSDSSAGPGGRRGGGPATQLDRVRGMSPAEFQQDSQRRADRMGGQASPQFQQYTSFMNQVRSMPQSQYLLQRDQLAVRTLDQDRGGSGAAPTGESEEAARAFIDRYFLSWRVPAVVQDQLQTR